MQNKKSHYIWLLVVIIVPIVILALNKINANLLTHVSHETVYDADCSAH